MIVVFRNPIEWLSTMWIVDVRCYQQTLLNLKLQRQDLNDSVFFSYIGKDKKDASRRNNMAIIKIDSLGQNPPQNRKPSKFYNE